MYYQEQTVLLASKHAKEQVIAEPFMNLLSCHLTVHDFDTDQFGTFTGEIARKLSPYDTCVMKAKTAAQRYNYTYAVASEGSYGPHPAFPFVPSAHELMVFIDRQHQWIISEQLVSQKTNFATLTIHQHSEISRFLEQVSFPSHALIVQAKTDQRVFAKGVRDLVNLNHYLSIGFKTEKELLLTTDMRAMMNPTRMALIGELADKLARRIATLCAGCNCPGFGLKTIRGTLPCSLCGSATTFYAEEVWGCIQCDHEEYKMRKDGLKSADPTYCHDCNP